MKPLHSVLAIASFAVVVLAITLGVATPGVTTPAVASAPLAVSSAPSEVPTKTEKDLSRANEVLDDLASRYTHLEGVKLVMGTTPKGEEAVAYYTVGEILISDTHTVSIEKILAHEVWHVIDWRDNGRLDWGEDLPPTNESEYYR